MKLANSRVHDIIKAAKYHYGGDQRRAIIKIVAAHAGLDSVTRFDAFLVMMHDTIELVCSDDPKTTFRNFLSGYVRDRVLAPQEDDFNGTLWNNYLALLTYLPASKFEGGLPPNCPQIDSLLGRSLEMLE